MQILIYYQAPKLTSPGFASLPPPNQLDQLLPALSAPPGAPPGASIGPVVDMVNKVLLNINLMELRLHPQAAHVTT